MACDVDSLQALAGVGRGEGVSTEGLRIMLGAGCILFFLSLSCSIGMAVFLAQSCSLEKMGVRPGAPTCWRKHSSCFFAHGAGSGALLVAIPECPSRPRKHFHCSRDYVLVEVSTEEGDSEWYIFW